MPSEDTSRHSKPASEIEPNLPEVLPAVELKGSRADRLRTVDVAIVRLHQLRSALIGEPSPPRGQSAELRGPYLNAPVWPWFAAGWILGALFVVLLLVARAYARGAQG